MLVVLRAFNDDAGPLERCILLLSLVQTSLTQVGTGIGLFEVPGVLAHRRSSWEHAACLTDTYRLPIGVYFVEWAYNGYSALLTVSPDIWKGRCAGEYAR